MSIFRKMAPKHFGKSNNSVTHNIGGSKQEPRKCPVCGSTTFRYLGSEKPTTIKHNDDWRYKVRLTTEIQYGESHKKFACSRCGTEID